MTSILQRECVEPGVALLEEPEKEDYLLSLKVRYLSTKYLNNIHLFFSIYRMYYCYNNRFRIMW